MKSTPKAWFFSSAWLPILAAGFSAPALAQNYVGQVLYRLSQPAGIAGPSAFSTVQGPRIEAGQTVGTGYVDQSKNGYNALLWSAGGVVSNLQPDLPGITDTYASNTDGIEQIGVGYSSSPTFTHALVWTGAASSAVDLNPSGYATSTAVSVIGGQQVGFAAQTGEADVAALWTGTAASFVNLNPPGYTGSQVVATDGTHQLGVGDSPGLGERVLLWSGTAASAVDVTPTGVNGTTAANPTGLGGNQIVGYTGGGPGDIYRRAYLWTESDTSAVDLTPTDLPGITGAVAEATNGSVQVGQANMSDAIPQAVAWFGTADSAIDLESLLPGVDPGALGTIAYSIDTAGDIFGIGEGTIDNQSGMFALEWTPVPEPAGIALVLMFVCLIRPSQK